MSFKKRPVPDNNNFLNNNINFLRPESPKTNFKKPRNSLKSNPKKILLYFFVFTIIIILGFSSRVIMSSSEALHSLGGGGILSQIKNLLIKNEKDIAGIKQDRVNILILGVGGAGHPGAYLTDTILLVSLKPKDNKTALISIPRDLYVVSDVLGGVKINSIYTYGNHAPGFTGGELLKSAVGKTFGIDVHYYALIDFNGFVKLIDALGGINVYVEKSFTDNKFPDANYKTQTITFKKGWQHFNGLDALRFARSRHGNAGEGSDFARAKRQQQVVMAVKEKIIGLGVLLRPDKINKIIQLLGESVDTDIQIWEMVNLSSMVKKVSNQNIKQLVLTNGPQGQLKETAGVDGAFLLVPKDKQELQNLIQNIFVYD